MDSQLTNILDLSQNAPDMQDVDSEGREIVRLD